MSLLAGSPDLAGLSDDRIVVREVGGELRAHGTPWAGTNPIVSRDSASLRAIAFVPRTLLSTLPDSLGMFCSSSLSLRPGV